MNLKTSIAFTFAPTTLDIAAQVEKLIKANTETLQHAINRLAPVTGLTCDISTSRAPKASTKAA